MRPKFLELLEDVESKHDSDQFRKWFANSKVRDEEGNPLVVYHQTGADFDTFLPGGHDKKLSGPAIWFAAPHHREHLPSGHNQGKGSQRVIPCYLRINNPLVLDSKSMRDWAKEVFAKGFSEFPFLLTAKQVAELKKDGYDGIFFSHKIDPENPSKEFPVDEYIVFDSNQIKSSLSSKFSLESDKYTESMGDADSLYSRLAAKKEEGTITAAELAEVSRLVKEAAMRAGYTHELFHGTPTGGFTVFKERPTYFSAKKDIADIYQSRSASSIRTWAIPDDSVPETKAVFVRAENIFDTRTPAHRKLFDTEFFQKGGEEWQSNGTPLSDKGLPDWTDGRDLIDWFEETGKNFDGLILDEGGLPTEDGVRSRDVSIIVWNPSQIKSANPFTYDDAGTLVPLSNRFNSGSVDIRESKTDTPEFKRWFGKSLVVDDAGKPLVVYRGEHGEFQAMKSKEASLSFGSKEAASLYAEHPNDRSMTATHSRVYPVYLRIENPFMNDPDDPFIDFSLIRKVFSEEESIQIALEFESWIKHTNNWEEIEEEFDVLGVQEFLDKGGDIERLYFDVYNLLREEKWVKILKSKGFDGAIHGGSGNTSGEPEYKVFDISQVKSVFNRGTFDLNSPNITEEKIPIFSRLAHEMLISHPFFTCNGIAP